MTDDHISQQHIDSYMHSPAAPEPLMELLQNQQVSEESKQKIAKAINFEEMVWEVLRTVYDPEIPVNIVELGLVYEVDFTKDNDVEVQMTLTAPSCPVAGALPGIVEERLKDYAKDIRNVHVELVWDPPWDQSMMSEAAQLELGLL